VGLIELLKAAIYGVVEGITEWLPISSTGHMLLLEQFMPLGVSKDFWDMFLVVIQLGAIIAVLISFFHELNPFSRSKSAGERRSTWTLWGKTIVACIPAAVVGLPLDDWIEDHLGGPFVIAAALIVYGIVFIVIESIRERRAQRLAAAFSATRPAASYRPRHFSSSLLQPQQGLTASQVADAEARIQDIDDLDWKTALGIGLFQVLSIVPGTSRSGSTIIGGLILGCSRTCGRAVHVLSGHPRHGGCFGAAPGEVLPQGQRLHRFRDGNPAHGLCRGRAGVACGNQVPHELCEEA
jgi:undecaprenyl-diphosphatase